jgi:hypothetical protein
LWRWGLEREGERYEVLPCGQVDDVWHIYQLSFPLIWCAF